MMQNAAKQSKTCSEQCSETTENGPEISEHG